MLDREAGESLDDWEAAHRKRIDDVASGPTQTFIDGI